MRAAVIAVVLLATTAQARKPRGAVPMGDAIVAICEYLIDKQLTARAAATKLGMHLHDEIGSITFTPRDRRFSHGDAVREAESQELGHVELKLAPETKLTFAELRGIFGTLKGYQHDHNQPRWRAKLERPGKSLVCYVAVELRGDPDEAGDDAEVKLIVFNPGPKL